MKIFDIKKEILKYDLEEFKIFFILKYYEIVVMILVQKVEFERYFKSLIIVFCKRGEEWYSEIDEIINKRKIEIN